MVLLAGCGGASSSGAPVDEVRAAILGFGNTQEIRCEDAGAELEGRAVVRCGFAQEANESGAMTAQARCFVVRDGEVVDVTRSLPIGDLRTCELSAP